MARFQFSLKTVLQFRRRILERQEFELGRLAIQASAIQEAMRQLAGEYESAAAKLINERGVEGDELAALDAFRERTARERERLGAQLAEQLRSIAAKRIEVQTASRDVRLLEKLEQRRRAEWQYEQDRETEAAAADSFMALWAQGAKDI